MRIKLMTAMLAGAAMLSPALAQTSAPSRELPHDRGYDKPSPRTDAINAHEGHVTDSLNAQANGAATANATASTTAQAQYEVDRQSYMDALIKHDAAVDRTDMRYARQQRAYADAMAVWRIQVQECKKGHRRACDLPPPSVSDYY